MTWNQTNATQQKINFINAVKSQPHAAFAVICAAFGISRQTGYQTLRQYNQHGVAAFEPKSRRPLHSPQAMSREIEERILEMRRTHPTWGARKILAILLRQSPRVAWPVASSVGDLLRRRGLTHPAPRRHRAAPFSQPLGHSLAPNDVWCVDFKGWFRTLDGTRCNPLTITDATTRMLLRCNHVRAGTTRHAQAVFEAAFREFGLPLAIRSDNGTPFSSTGIAGLSRLAVWWVRLGIWPERTEPGCPQQNGRHERMHRTLQQEVAAKPEANVRLQQRAFDRFRLEFNTVRPHEALGQLPPADFYVPSPRPFPKRLPEIVYPAESLVRRVRGDGCIKHLGRSHYLGDALTGEDVALWEVDGGWDVYFGLIHLAYFDADTERLVRTSS